MSNKEADPDSKKLWEEFNTSPKISDACNDCNFLQKMLQAGVSEIRYMGFYPTMGFVMRNIEVRHCPGCGRRLI